MKTIDMVTRILIVIGALNWGLVGLFGFDLVAALAGRSFGELTGFTRVIYALVGLSGIYQLFGLFAPAPVARSGPT